MANGLRSPRAVMDGPGDPRASAGGPRDPGGAADGLRLGTRGSALALAQARGVAAALEANGTAVEIVTVKVSGDGGASPLSDKGRFVRELDEALLAGEIDLAVHSAKDVPGELPAGIEIVAVPERADPRDALCLGPELAAHPAEPPAGRAPAARPLDPLPPGAVVGTASLRRRAELLALRPDLQIHDLRGNVDTRLRRLASGEPAAADQAPATGRAAAGSQAASPDDQAADTVGEGAPAPRAARAGGPRLDAIVLAAAGLARLGRTAAGTPLPEHALVPAPGQGCLALAARADDEATRRIASRLTDPEAFACLTAERTAVVELGATCHTPVGAHAAVVDHGVLELTVFVGTPDGARWIREELRGPAESPQGLGRDAAARLAAAGAADILAASETAADGEANAR